MKNTKLAFCKFSKYPILKSIRVKFSRYKQKSMNVSVSFDTLIILGKFFPDIQKTPVAVLHKLNIWLISDFTFLT